MDDDISSNLMARAHRAALNAYAPYSGFRVGAALLAETGAIQLGCNVENASLPVGVCAERNAIAAAVAAEGPGLKIAAISILALDPTGEPVACAPCGACRQAIIEFGPTARVIFRTGSQENSDAIVTVQAEALLPGAFSFTSR